MLIDAKTNGEALKLAKALPQAKVIKKIKDSGLTGRGGANFSTGQKWEFLSKASGDKILICNADEGEPGTFKDKHIIENNPESLIEGIHIACYALDAKIAYIYLRSEYKIFKKRLEEIINDFKNKVAEIKIILGAGAYICGDETAILNSIEGVRAFPRHKPPFPTDKGLFQKPTCINNVETLTNIPYIFLNEKWDPNLRLFSISGDVKNPSIVEKPYDITLEELLKDANPKEEVKAISFGAAGGIIPYNAKQKLNIEMLRKKGIIGICTSIIVIGKSRSMLDICKNIASFFEHESCGKCFPCRSGTYHILDLLNKIKASKSNNKSKENYISLLKELGEYITESSFCGLGQSAFTHLKTAFQHFPSEF